jgi:hypothetical protein
MRNWKDCGRERLRPNLKYYPGIFLEKLRKTTKISGKSVLGPRFEPETSKIRSSSVNHLTTTVGTYPVNSLYTDVVIRTGG